MDEQRVFPPDLLSFLGEQREIQAFWTDCSQPAAPVPFRDEIYLIVLISSLALQRVKQEPGGAAGIGEGPWLGSCPGCAELSAFAG